MNIKTVLLTGGGESGKLSDILNVKRKIPPL